MRSDAAFITSLPTSVDPVNESLRTPGCAESAAPASGPKPVMTLSTPFGRNSWQMRAIHRMPSGASSAAFSTRVLPAHSAGAILSVPSMTGAFHGMIAPTTPIGSRRV